MANGSPCSALRIISQSFPVMFSNVVAFISQWLIMLWMFSFQLFLSGAFESIPTVLVGITPVLATTALVAWTCVVVMNETRTQLIQNNSTVDTSTQEMIVRHQNGDSSILTIQDFNTRYKPTHQGASDDLSLAGFGVYRPVSQVWSHQLTTKDIQRDFPMGRFISRSGAPVAVKTGQYIVMPFPQGDDVTIMNADVFENKYSKSTEEAFDGRVVSQAEALQKWEGVLRREGRIFSKVAKVHAQKMTEEGYIETVVDGKFEARRPYDKGDYVVCGSRGGRYPMEEDQFSSRYIISETEQASDPMLSKAGFRLFKAKGKVWSHKLTLEEVAEHFPSGRLLGKCTCP